MVKRYLLFDSNCSVCINLATSIEKESNGWLTIQSLHNPEMKERLNQVKPDWTFEPTILEVKDNQKTRVYTGVRLKTYILNGLGLRKSLRIAKLIRDAGVPGFSKATFTPTMYQGRRSFVKKGGMLLGGVLLSPLLTSILPPRLTKKALAATTDDYDSLTPKNWKTKVKIKESKELSGEEVQKYLTSDVQEALSFKEIGTSIDRSNVKGVFHMLEDGNTLVALVTQKGDYISVHYALSYPIYHFGRGSYLYKVDEKNETVTLVDQLVNGEPVKDANQLAACGNCSIDNFSYGGGSECTSWNISCLIQCCGPCTLACGTWAGCLPCVLLWCPVCSSTCCTGWEETCYSCA
ncbi:hypothetical protein [Alkalihalobacillus sp. TS-13]|uniref:hypothetical protein n=1 Tax=Alkalihalobacillus sp. TS-13 TaxID=2842455 RepID=UPI001C86FEA0|nr:hypothetical protein [Alkalihalobacillus sp. TS-13]